MSHRSLPVGIHSRIAYVNLTFVPFIRLCPLLDSNRCPILSNSTQSTGRVHAAIYSLKPKRFRMTSTAAVKVRRGLTASTPI